MLLQEKNNNKTMKRSVYMSFTFDNRKKDNKAQWHFGKSSQTKGYDPIDEDIQSDILGSYTGTSYDDLYPVQDADDL
jgi:hypothetical protein